MLYVGPPPPANLRASGIVRKEVETGHAGERLQRCRMPLSGLSNANRLLLALCGWQPAVGEIVQEGRRNSPAKPPDT